MLFLLPEEGLQLGRLAAEFAVSQLWQGVAVAVGLAVCLRLAPRTRASHRFALWLAAFVLVALLPLAPGILNRLLPSAPAMAPSPDLSAAPVWFRLDERWGMVVLAIWGLLAGMRLAKLVAGAVRARGIWKSARPFRSDVLDSMPEGLEISLMAGRGPVELCVAPDLERPSVIGFFRPRVLVPEWLAAKLSAAELRQIVLHELEHLRRMDDWTNLLLKLATALLPLNPALGWMERQLEREREMATDEAVVRRTRAPRAYAACLASVAERRLQMRMGQRELLELGIWRRRPELAERILSLLKAKETIGPRGRAALAGSLATGLVAAVVALAHAPQLVAFAPAALPVTVATVQPAPAQVVPARVQLEVKPKTSAARRGVHAANSSSNPATEPHESAPVEGFVPVVAQMDPEASGSGQQAEGWVVLAVFEQHVVAASRPAVQADYRTGGAESGAAPAEPKAAPAASARTKPVAPAETLWKLLPVVPLEQGWVVLDL